MKQICNFISRYVGVIVFLVAVVALLLPESFRWIDTMYINPLLGLVMIGMGLVLNPNDFKIVLSRPKEVGIGCLAQFIIMPGLAWLLPKAFQLPPELAIGVILVGCCPSGTASNVMTYLAKGDLALSVGVTLACTILAPFLTPILTWMIAGTYVHVDALSMFLSIVQVVILPIIVGLIVQKYCPKFTSKAVGYLPGFSSIAIALIAGIIVSHSAERLMSCGLTIVLVVILHNICGFLLGFTAGKLLRLEYKKCVAISIEVGMQNSGLACALATLHFAAYPLATIPGAIFSVWHNISGALVARLYSASGVKAFWAGFQHLRKQG